jgi:phage host-nuclease inhibitor protein Gam
LQSQLTGVLNEKTDMLDQMRKTTSERDSTREDLKEMTASRTNLQKEKEQFATQMKDKLNTAEADIKEKKERIENLIMELEKMTK